MNRKLFVLFCASSASLAPVTARAQATRAAAWDSVGRVLQTPTVETGGYYRYNFPRRDITLRVGDVTLAPALALGAWAGFSGEPDDATLMGDLVLTASELGPVLAELATQRVDVTAVHNHLAGGDPQIIYVHFHAQGRATDLGTRLEHALALTATPRPVAAGSPQPLAIDTATVFGTLGIAGRAQGNVAQVTTILVPGAVTMHGRALTPALAYGSPINIQMAGANRAVATGDLAVLGPKVDPVLDAFAAHHITTTAVHSHLIGESPTVYYIHFWADGSLADVLRGLRAGLDAGR
jgi:hypothetical protein